MPSIIIAESQEVTRYGLSCLLQQQSDLTVVGEAENGQQVLDILGQKNVDIVLMATQMPVMDGITTVKLIKEKYAGVKVIMLGYDDKPEPFYAALAAGAHTYCLHNIRIERLTEVIDMVMDGAMWLDPAFAEKVMEAFPNGVTAQVEPKLELSAELRTALTDREQDVLRLIAAGKNNKEIAEELSITIHTVKIHVGNIIQKLSVNDRTQAAIKALKDGLV